jgi:hypothetical protein
MLFRQLVVCPSAAVSVEIVFVRRCRLRTRSRILFGSLQQVSPIIDQFQPLIVCSVLDSLFNAARIREDGVMVGPILWNASVLQRAVLRKNGSEDHEAESGRDEERAEIGDACATHDLFHRVGFKRLGPFRRIFASASGPHYFYQAVLKTRL